MSGQDFKQPADGVIFDCDSTLSTVEGIDELAGLAGVRETVARLTNEAMSGKVPLEAVYCQRLDLIAPSRKQLAQIANQYLENIVLGAKESIQILQQRGIRVGIVSGGLRPAILPLAATLGIAEEDVFAVELQFDEQGHYEQVLPSPLTTANGKREVVAAWKVKHHLQRVFMIGDGMSDVAALGGADAVIGFGGVVIRPPVREKATIFIENPDLRALLPLILAEQV